LERILVYWLAIAHAPKGILDKIMKKCKSILWIGRKQIEGIPLIKWSKLARPKEVGG
jgi:hypothetical protein